MPNDGEWDTWRATLPEEYDHVSEIGQPAKFAQALARMVAEQIGPQGKDGWIKDTTEGVEGTRTKHRLQWVMHGPVVYTDRVYDTVSRDCDERTGVAAKIFTKSTKYAAQREYRFAILNEGAEEETVILQVSGMMRDALKRTEGGLIRVAPASVATAGDDEVESSSRITETRTPVYKRTTVKERLTEREERRWETRTPDGQVKSSDSERRERIGGKTATQYHEPDNEDLQPRVRMDRDDDGTPDEQLVPELVQSPQTHDKEHSEEEAVQELALEEREWDDGRQGDSDTIPVVHRGSGRAYKSFKEMFEDPASPMSPMKEAWQERKCSPEEITKTYGAVDILLTKMAHVREECRQEVASAGWHAMYCIRNIYACLGDIVEELWIERERFVVIRIKESKNLNATGRIVIAPSGAYAYCLQLPDRETSGSGGIEWGTMFFPMGNDVETFETFGWPGKTS